MRELEVGLILLDSSFKPRASNREAVRVLSFPTDPGSIPRLDAFLADKVRTSLVARNGAQESSFVPVFRSGKRRYNCTAFRLGEGAAASGAAVLLLLQRPMAGTVLSTWRISRRSTILLHGSGSRWNSWCKDSPPRTSLCG